MTGCQSNVLLPIVEETELPKANSVKFPFLHRQTKPTSTRKERFSQTSQMNPQVVRRSFKRSACNRLSLRFLRLKTGLKDLQGPPRTTLPTPLYRHYFKMSRWHTHKICHIHQERASCSVLEETARSDRGSEVAKKSWEEELVLTRTGGT